MTQKGDWTFKQKKLYCKDPEAGVNLVWLEGGRDKGLVEHEVREGAMGTTVVIVIYSEVEAIVGFWTEWQYNLIKKECVAAVLRISYIVGQESGGQCTNPEWFSLLICSWNMASTPNTESVAEALVVESRGMGIRVVSLADGSSGQDFNVSIYTI